MSIFGIRVVNSSEFQLCSAERSCATPTGCTTAHLEVRHWRLNLLSPTVVEDTVFIGSCAGVFYALNKATGKMRWSYDIRQDGKQISFHGNPLVVDDMILIGTTKVWK